MITNAMGTKENKNAGWMPIKGFDGYMVNKKGEVMSLKRGRLLANTYGKCIKLSVKGREYSFTPQRILYAAIHGINPSEIGHDVIIINTGKKLSAQAIKVIDKRDVFGVYNKKDVIISPYASQQEEYSVIIEFSTYAKNLDVEGMWKIFNKVKPKIMKFIERFVKNGENKELHFQHVCAYIIDGIVEGRYVVSEPVRYARRMFKNRISNRSIESLFV